MTKKSRGRKYGFKAPHGLSNGKKVTVYLSGGAERWGEDWRMQVFFFGWKGKPPDEYLLYRHTYNGKVLQARQSNVERIEEGWNGVPLDVRQVKQHEVEKQVKKAERINKAAPVTVTEEPKKEKIKMRALPESLIDEALDFLESDESEDLSQHELSIALGIGHGSMTAIYKAHRGEKIKPSYNRNLYNRTVKRIAQRKKLPPPPEVHKEQPALQDALLTSASPLAMAIFKLNDKRQALMVEVAKLDAKIEVLREVEQEYFN